MNAIIYLFSDHWNNSDDSRWHWQRNHTCQVPKLSRPSVIGSLHNKQQILQFDNLSSKLPNHSCKVPKHNCYQYSSIISVGCTKMETITTSKSISMLLCHSKLQWVAKKKIWDRAVMMQGTYESAQPNTDDLICAGISSGPAFTQPGFQIKSRVSFKKKTYIYIL